MSEAGIEPATPSLEGSCSIRLSYSPALETIFEETYLFIVNGRGTRFIKDGVESRYRVY